MFFTMTDCRRRIIEFQVSKRSHDLVFVNPGNEELFNSGNEDVLGINQIDGAVSEAEKLWESLETLKENNSTMVTEKDAVEVLLDNEKTESDSFRSANAVISARIDELKPKFYK